MLRDPSLVTKLRAWSGSHTTNPIREQPISAVRAGERRESAFWIPAGRTALG